MKVVKGDYVAVVYSIMGTEYVNFNQKIAYIDGSGIVLEGSDSISYDPKTGREVEPVIPNCFSFLSDQKAAVKGVKDGLLKLDGEDKIPTLKVRKVTAKKKAVAKKKPTKKKAKK